MYQSLSYLANNMRVGDRGIPYSTVVAIDMPGKRMKEGEIALGQWAADDLSAKGGRLAHAYLLHREQHGRVSGDIRNTQGGCNPAHG